MNKKIIKNLLKRVLESPDFKGILMDAAEEELKTSFGELVEGGLVDSSIYYLLFDEGSLELHFDLKAIDLSDSIGD